MASVTLCGTPHEHCSGASLTTNAMLKTSKAKGHPDPTSAYRCYRRYLVSVLGYEDIGSRCFRPPDGGYVRVLTRKSRFGETLRAGKENTRWMPDNEGSGAIIKT